MESSEQSDAFISSLVCNNRLIFDTGIFHFVLSEYVFASSSLPFFIKCHKLDLSPNGFSMS